MWKKRILLGDSGLWWTESSCTKEKKYLDGSSETLYKRKERRKRQYYWNPNHFELIIVDLSWKSSLQIILIYTLWNSYQNEAKYKNKPAKAQRKQTQLKLNSTTVSNKNSKLTAASEMNTICVRRPHSPWAAWPSTAGPSWTTPLRQVGPYHCCVCVWSVWR